MSNLNNESGQSFFCQETQAIKPQIFGAVKLQVLSPNADSKTLILKGSSTVNSYIHTLSFFSSILELKV